MELNDLVKSLLSELNKISKSDAVAGKVRDAGKAKVLPLSKISLAFGTGIGEVGGKSEREGAERDAEADGGGAAGALAVEPKAFVVIADDGKPHMLAIKRGKKAVLRHGIEIAPDEIGEALPGDEVPRLGSKKK